MDAWPPGWLALDSRSFTLVSYQESNAIFRHSTPFGGSVRNRSKEERVMVGGPIRKLVGWKEIAEYLGTSPRTVQRWEQEKGLPVQRVPGSSGHSVFADSGELDRWLASGAPVESSGQTALDSVIRFPATDGVRPLLRRYPALPLAALTALAVVIVLAGAIVRAHPFHSRGSQTLKTAGGFPAITSVGAIAPTPDQVIVIRGHGLGSHCFYANEDVPFIAIRDKTARWAAGRIIPENWDEVTLNVANWTDSEIDVTGFAGAYGLHWWKVSLGDQIEVAVWNPQSQAGPALYELTVTSPGIAQK